MPSPLANSKSWQSYLDLDEIKEYLQFSWNASNARDSILQRTIDMACTWVQTFCGRPIAPTGFVERHDGWAGDTIILHHSPMLELVYCTEFMANGGNLNLPESTPENPIDGVQVNYPEGWIMRVFAGYAWPRPFFPGARNIEISYVAGWNPIPPDLWMATAELTRHWWVNTQEASRSQTARPDSFDSDTSPAMFPGVPYRVLELIDTYRLPSMA